MTSGRLKIRPDLAWFPAPYQWRTAINQLSDGAFKLFVYVCLNADRSTCRFDFRQTVLARELKKSRRSIALYLQELQANRICLIRLSANQHAAGNIEIQAPYWPYQWEPQPSVASSSEPHKSYVQTIQTYLYPRACIRCPFSALDRRLAEEWFCRKVPLWQIEHAVLMACGRKYVSWLNGTDSQPIGSLKYFEQVLEEVLNTNTSPEYLEFSKQQVIRLEQKWLASERARSLAPAQSFRRQTVKNSTEIR
jgi:hypothetical protein